MQKDSRLSEVSLSLDGKVVSEPQLVTKYGGTKVLRVEIENKRRSGVVDRFYLHYSNELGVVLKVGMFVRVTGDIRTLNDKDYVICSYVNASSIKVLDEEPESYINSVEIKNAYLQDFFETRNSYTDDTKTVATYRIRVSRSHSRHSYFRVTTWGKDAIFLGNAHNSFEYMHLKGRLQSYTSKASGKLQFSYVTYFVEVEHTAEDKTDHEEDQEPVESEE